MIDKWKQYKSFIILAIVSASLIIYALSTYNYLAAYSIFICALIGYFLLIREHKKMQSEFIQISDLITKMIDQEECINYQVNDDILFSKIQHQLLRLHTLYHQQQDNVRKDRDEIRLLINDIAHQMRTPLSNMKLFLELLETEPMNTSQRTYVDNIEMSTEAISFLSESFIKMSRIEGKVLQLKMKNQSLCETIQEAIDVNQEKAKEKSVSIQFEISHQDGILHDRQWMREAISNVIDNAIKYSGLKSSIDIEVISTDMFIELQIQDNGVGIQKEDEQNIFKRFYRGKNTNQQDGFGLGLYITQTIIQKHNGFIKVKSNDEGTLFTIILPR